MIYQEISKTLTRIRKDVINYYLQFYKRIRNRCPKIQLNLYL